MKENGKCVHVRVKGLRPSPSELIGRWILWKGHVVLAGPFAVSQHLRPRCSAFCAHLHPQGWRCGACSCFLSLLEEGEDTSFLSLCVCASPSSPRAQNPTTCRQLPSGGTSQIPGSGSTAAPSGCCNIRIVCRVSQRAVRRPPVDREVTPGGP